MENLHTSLQGCKFGRRHPYTRKISRKCFLYGELKCLFKIPIGLLMCAVYNKYKKEI